METRCDQLVLEHLEGEERREYGHILLSMVNERFAKTPGTTCVNNGDFAALVITTTIIARLMLKINMSMQGILTIIQAITTIMRGITTIMQVITTIMQDMNTQNK